MPRLFEEKAAIAAEKAAIAKTTDAAKKDKYEEWGGWIITKDGKNFTYTVAVTFGDPEHFFTDSVTIPKGYAPVADYHTHPDPSPVGEGFSPGDMARSERNQMNAYVGMSYWKHRKIKISCPSPAIWYRMGGNF